MKENIKYFETLNDADEYIINDVPFTGYIKENKLVLFNNEPNKMLIILNGQAIIYNMVDAIFDTLNNADGYIIENIPFSCYIKENQQFLECNLVDCKIVVKNGIAIIKEMNDIIRYTATSKVTPYRPSSLPTIISNDFDSNTGKGVIKFEADVTNIGQYAFFNRNNLTFITIPNSVTSIGERAFNSCRSLTSVTIGNSVTSIGSSAFQGCSSLTSVTIPDSVTSIGNNAFYECSSLPVIDDIRYADIYLVEAEDKTLSNYSIKKRTRFIGEEAFNNCDGLTSITIPNSVTSIGGYAFSGCSSLTSIIIPNSVTSIGNTAFLSTGLTSVTIPNSVTSIGDNIFLNCSSLISINVAFNNSNYCSVDGVLFNKDKTILIQYPGGKQGTYTIPDSVTRIKTGAFSGCSSLTSVTISNSVTSIEYHAFGFCWSLTSVIIGNSVASIGYSAFYNCRRLNSISYTGTILQYNSITKGSDWHYRVPATVVHCTDGDTPI